MAENITLTNLVNLQNPTTAVNAINANNSIITTAFQDVLSRSGIAPNYMTNQLDMNSNQIINLPAPTSSSSPLRVQDATTLNGNGTITVNPLPTGGTTGQVLTKNSATNFDTSWQTVTGGTTTYTAPFVSAVSRTVPNKLSDLVSVLDFGVSNTGADCSTTLQNAITNGGSAIIIPPGTYNLTGSIQIPSNIYLWIQKGANITFTGGRITSHIPGGGNIYLQIDGKISFLSTATRADITDWDTSPGTSLGGVIEIGGSLASPMVGVWVVGTGEVLSDYVWPGSPPSSYFNFPFQMQRKGIALFYVNKGRVEGLNVHNIYGEAIYHESSGGEYDVQFNRNHVHECAFNGLNFNTFGLGRGFAMRGNYVQNVWHGIEASTGLIEGNYILTATSGIITGAGGGAGPISIKDNVFSACVNGISVSFNPSTIEHVIISGNFLNNLTGPAINVNNIDAFTIQNNVLLTWATTTAGAGILINSAASNGYVTGNFLRAPGALSTGNVVNNGTGVTIGTNPVV